MGTTGELLKDDRFPRSSKYDADWLIDGCFGANPLWLAEWLCAELDLQPGMRVLDLGCGRAKSSIFLAREFGAQVWAADLWVDPTENETRIRDAGLEEKITALRVDARELPFEDGFFDAILAFDSFQYFGTDCLCLPYLVQFLQHDGFLGFASAGLMEEFEDGIPDHLARFWTSDAWCLRTAEWWRDHWGRTGLVDVSFAEVMPEGWKLWLRWARANGSADWYLQTLEDDAGRHLGYIRALAKRRADTAHLTHDLRTGRVAN